MLSASQAALRRILLPQQAQHQILHQQLAIAGRATMYTWDGQNRSGGFRQGQTDRRRLPDHNEIRLRGTITQVQQANNRFCRFLLRTNQLYKHVNPGGSWRWAESKTVHTVVGAGARLPNYLAVLAVGARVDLAGVVTYQPVAPAGTPASGGSADQPADGAGAGAGVGTEADKHRRSVVRLVWIKPVEEEESVEISFDVQLEDHR